MTTTLEPHLELERVGVDDPAWKAFVGADPEASAFHHPAWATLVERCYGFESFVLVERGQDGTVMGGLPIAIVANPFRPRRWVGLPFVDYLPPLGSLGNHDGLASQLRLEARRDGIRSVEVRAPLGNVREGDPQSVRHVLQLLADPEEQFSQFHRMTRRNVRQAERNGVVRVEVGDDRSALTDVFFNLHLRTRRRQGTPVQPRRFFRLLWDELFTRGLGDVFVASVDRVPIAAAVFLRWNGNVIYKFGASDPAAWSHRPNNLIFWHAIRRSIELGDRTLDFGRSEVSQDGLRSFKLGWGAEESPLRYSRLAAQPTEGGPARHASSLVPIVRRSPLWVTRLLGELFYRYAA